MYIAPMCMRVIFPISKFTPGKKGGNILLTYSKPKELLRFNKN